MMKRIMLVKSTVTGQMRFAGFVPFDAASRATFLEFRFMRC